MLKQPHYAYYSEFGVTAYQDDTLWWKFYLIPDVPTIRKDENGNPVFLLVKYALSDQSREENPELPRGGGYMAFDVELKVQPDDEAQIRVLLQQSVNADWQRLKDLAASAGNNVQGYRIYAWNYIGGNSNMQVDDLNLGLNPNDQATPPGAHPPQVILGMPTWVAGTFKVLAPQSANLVTNRVAEGPASLVGANVVAANLDLTEDGATFMQRTLVETEAQGGDGSGATDIVPIQVVYDLTMKARIPPATMLISADTRSLYSAMTNISHDYDDNSCSEDAIRNSEQHMEMAIQSGLIDIKIDTGMLDLKDDFVKQLQQFAMDTVESMIKAAFLDKKEQSEDEGEDEGDEAKRWQDSGTDYYSIKQNVNFESISFKQKLTLESTVDWKIAPQGTMQTFFSGLSKEEMRKYVREIDLDDDFFKTLGLEVNVYADWDNEPLAFVECQVRYEGRDENDQHVEKVETFTFTKAQATQAWNPSLIGGKREYQYRWRVGFQGREPGEFTRWERDKTPHLNISVADPGKIAISVLAGSIDFDQTVKQVQVELSYKDMGSDVDEEATVLVLSSGAQEQKYERYIFTNWDRPVRYRSTFILADGQRIVSEWQETLSRQLMINQPFFDKLDVQLVPAGNWNGVVQTVISLRYEDMANDYHGEGVFSIKKIDEFKTWAVVLRDKRNRRFQYKVLTSFQDGNFKESAWLSGDGDQAMPVIVQQTPQLNVKLLPNLVDFKVTPVVECTLRYDDPQGRVHQVATQTFIAGEPQSWSFPIAETTRRSYRQQLIYHTVEGGRVVQPEATTDVTALVIPKLLTPEVVCTVVPKLVAFADTPLVEVNISYSDERGETSEETLIFADATPQVFRVQVREDSPRE
ncbi:MAG: hypothetical protein H7Z42_06475, partial [Roseiflexaceae bacterium]|nr:hypothetical protein [Roseiflexaceae bacterium]